MKQVLSSQGVTQKRKDVEKTNQFVKQQQIGNNLHTTRLSTLSRKVINPKLFTSVEGYIAIFDFSKNLD